VNFELLPHQGLPELPFGIPPAAALTLLGPPDLVEEESEQEAGFHLFVQVFEGPGLSLFYNSGPEPLLRAIESVNKSLLLWDTKVFDLNEQALYELLKSRGELSLEREKEAWGESRITSPEFGIDFYFENGKMSAIYWEAAS
jgi:hypothetical protein